MAFCTCSSLSTYAAGPTNFPRHSSCICKSWIPVCYSYRRLIQLGIEFTHLFIGTHLTAQRERHSRLVLDRHFRVCKRDHEAVVRPCGNTLAGQECGLRLQMLKLNVFGLTEHGNRLLSGIAGLKSSTSHLNLERENGHAHGRVVVDG